MSEINLDPFAANVHFQLIEAVESDAWKEILSRFMGAIADRCDRTGRCTIGHIKGLALGPDKSYLNINVISTSYPADIKGWLAGEISSELMLTLNVLVYGLSGDDLKCIVQEVSTDSVQGLVKSITVQQTQGKSGHVNGKTNKKVFPVFPE